MVSAHTRLRAADAFLAAVARASGSKAHFLLDRLCLLFLLRELSEHTGDLLAEGHLTPDGQVPRATARRPARGTSPSRGLRRRPHAVFGAARMPM
ncbi:hypothetical protein K7472_22270 [Streptomyces sp. PTM05]|uniref:Acyl-CoA oxidase C-terminal domain-containing protein n=2 Tax=Streptantibioticus parmotrematis TaxID=2873249 RepID=A0ABS7QWF5_9ACTN|nr:hypothetical protein [Streptantibioticus parmotrematis]